MFVKLGGFREKVAKTLKLLPPLVVRDLKERHAGSALGVFWTFFQPLLIIMLYWVVFAKIIRIRIPSDTGDLPYLPFLLSGLLPWFAISEGLLRGASSIVDKAYIIKKVVFPPELLTITAVVSSFLYHSVGMLIFLVVYFAYTGAIGVMQIVLLPVFFALQLVLTIGLAMALASLAVYLRDVIQMLTVLIQAFFYMTTILYSISSVPEGLRGVVKANPFTALMESYHNIIFYGRLPEMGHVIYLLVATFVSLAVGRFLFKRLKGGFADVL